MPGGDRDHGLASAAVAGDGERLAVARADGTLLVVRISDGAVLFRDHPADHVLKFAAWSSDGARLAIASTTGTGLIEYAAAGAFARLPSPELGALRRVVALHSGARIAAPYAIGLHIISAQGTVLPYAPTPVAGEAQSFRDLAVSAGQRYGVAVDAAGGFHRIDDGANVAIRPLASVPGAEVADISRDGARIAVGSEGRIALLAGDGRPLAAAATGGDRIHDVAFSPDGRWLALGELSGTARILDATTLQLRAVLAGHARRVSAVAFDPAGRWLATASWDGSARLWDLPTLTTPAATLLTQAEARWGLELERALGR